MILNLCYYEYYALVTANANENNKNLGHPFIFLSFLNGKRDIYLQIIYGEIQIVD